MAMAKHGKRKRLDPAVVACKEARYQLVQATKRHGPDSLERDRAKAQYDVACLPGMETEQPPVYAPAMPVGKLKGHRRRSNPYRLGHPLHQVYTDPDRWAARVRKDEGRCVVCGRPQYKDAEGYVHELNCVFDEDGEQRCVHADDICDPTGEIREALREGDFGRESMNTLTVSSAPRAHVTGALEAELSRQAMRRTGPLLDVTIQATCKDGSACPPVKGKALLDTGASKTALDFGAVEGAKPEGFINARGPTSDEIRLPLYKAKLSFPGTELDAVSFDDAAASPHLRGQGLVALLGRDFLEHADLTYHGPTGEVTVTTPSGGAVVTSSPGAGTVVAALGGVLAAGALLTWWLLPPPCPSPSSST